MGYGSNPRNKSKRFSTYGSGRGVYLTNEMKESIAYRVLTASEKLVLQEMKRAYDLASLVDTISISDVGFIFAYSQCLEDVDEGTFGKSRRTVCGKGWFRLAPHLMDQRPGSPNRYLPSTDWRDYEPTSQEHARLRKSKVRKQNSIARAKKRRADYCVAHFKGTQGQTK